MEFTTGTILEGKVKSITKFGAFVSLGENRTGMVHISEIAHSYVNDIAEHLKEGQDVKVMVLGEDERGKINLSIKRTIEKPRQETPVAPRRFEKPRLAPAGARVQVSANKETNSFDDMLKQFMADSDSKMSTLRQHSDNKRRRR